MSIEKGRCVICASQGIPNPLIPNGKSAKQVCPQGQKTWHTKLERMIEEYHELDKQHSKALTRSITPKKTQREINIAKVNAKNLGEQAAKLWQEIQDLTHKNTAMKPKIHESYDPVLDDPDDELEPAETELEKW